MCITYIVESIHQLIFRFTRMKKMVVNIDGVIMRSFQIFVDADACPVVPAIERIASKYHVPLHLSCDTNHVLQSAVGKVHVIVAGADAVDIAVANACQKGDVVVTQDYGVAAMVLGKGGYAVHQNGWQYTAENIDRLLYERYTVKKARRSSRKVHLKGPHKRTVEDNEKFATKVERLIGSLAQDS